MKNLIIYYFQILLPLPLLYFAAKQDPILFVVLLIFYYIYRIFTDYYRLKSKNVLKKNDFLLFIIPLWTIKYFKELYFEN
ncbi:hypothetical protein EAH81_15315 [Flavobacterium pectinovorum]|uniref:Uncharacterized protein n=1 Tax=Flavobacterium pectinovorum TaxID=29533 RepID=A0A502EM60_9FLAO|nr:hypothetical protein EAH81_15315 [Flavobacterium pectinovorum]